MNFEIIKNGWFGFEFSFNSQYIEKKTNKKGLKAV